jgi:hypothetical protein
MRLEAGKWIATLGHGHAAGKPTLKGASEIALLSGRNTEAPMIKRYARAIAGFSFIISRIFLDCRTPPAYGRSFWRRRAAGF